MALITGKHIPRRAVLRGLGAAVALPFLDAMVPARGLWSKTARAASLDRTRLVCIEMVHGAAGADEWGAAPHLWAPAENRPAVHPARTSPSPPQPLPQYP